MTDDPNSMDKLIAEVENYAPYEAQSLLQRIGSISGLTVKEAVLIRKLKRIAASTYETEA